MDHALLWGIFAVVVIVMVALDLGLHRKEPKAIGVREALARTAVWMALAFSFNGLVWWKDGPERAGEFLVCYLTEQALSVDNIFVFIVIFRFFSVPPARQHRVLLWGILGAVLFRAIFILAGVELVQRFEWTMYVLGAFLVYTGFKLFTSDSEADVHPEKNPLLKLVKRFLPVTTSLESGRFFVVENGKRMATPLFVALIVIESSDVMFAIDSVPAALAITQDRFVLYTSNVFAILGLRSLYFAVAGIIPYLHYLQHGLSMILLFIGAKMLLGHHVDIPIALSLGVVGGVLLVSIVASVVRARLIKAEIGHEPEAYRGPGPLDPQGPGPQESGPRGPGPQGPGPQGSAPEGGAAPGSATPEPPEAAARGRGANE